MCERSLYNSQGANIRQVPDRGEAGKGSGAAGRWRLDAGNSLIPEAVQGWDPVTGGFNTRLDKAPLLRFNEGHEIFYRGKSRTLHVLHMPFSHSRTWTPHTVPPDDILVTGPESVSSGQSDRTRGGAGPLSVQI